MIDPEIAANAAAFRQSLTPKIATNIATISAANLEKLSEAYARLTILQSWRTSIIETAAPKGAIGFYSEAQNDGLTSLLLANCGLWRPSLKSLRSLIENVIHCLYYWDHPVEYRRWEMGKERLTFQKLFDYFEHHPDVSDLPASLRICVSDLKNSYSNLSNVVHSSVIDFRMTDDLNQTKLWKTDNPSIGKWFTYYKNVTRDVNMLFLIILKSHLQGTSCLDLRKSLSTTITSSKDATIRSNIGVRIVRS